MTVKVAINGFGRIGRNVLRAIVESGRTDIQVVGHQRPRPGRDQRPSDALRFRPRPLPRRGQGHGDTIDVGTGPIKVTAIRNPAELPLGELGVDIALECTGIFTARDKAATLLTAGAKRVLVSAPSRRRRPDRRLWREPRQADQGSPGRLQRLLHHQLPGAGRQGAAMTPSASKRA